MGSDRPGGRASRGCGPVIAPSERRAAASGLRSDEALAGGPNELLTLFVGAALALLVAGCSTTDWNDMRENPREFFNLTSPALVTDARVDGQQVALKRGQALVVRLDEDASTSQRWELKPLPQGPVIAPVQHDYVDRTGTDAATNAPGEAVFRVRGVSTGTQTIVLEYRRADESAASKTVRFDVVVR